MKIHISSLASVLTALATFFTVGGALAITVNEPPDHSNFPPGTAHTLTLGTNTFTGAVATGAGADGQDNFQVTVPAGLRLTGVSKNVSGGGFNGFVTFNYNESLSGLGAASFTQGFPYSQGTYPVTVAANFSSGTSWTVTVTTAAAPDYTVTTTATGITVTDDAGNGDTLAITEPAAGQIKFAAAGRTFSVNGGALITGDSGNLSLTGVTRIDVSGNAGNDTMNVSAFGGSTFPSLSIYAGSEDDTVNLNGDITFASGRTLDVIARTLNVAANANLLVSGSGDIYVTCGRSVSLSSGASFETVNGDLSIEANQQNPATTGNFAGVNLSGATLRSSGSGDVTVKGRGGDDAAAGGQLGVGIFGGAQIIGGSGAVEVTGTGGASTNWINRGVTVYGPVSAITSTGGNVTVTGTGGALSSNYGIGVSVLNGGEISAGGAGDVTATGTGLGVAGGGANQGVELGGNGSRITSAGGNVTVIGSAGPGGSSGILVVDTGNIATPAVGGNVVLEADSISLDGTSTVSATSGASTVTLQTHASTTRINLGGADDNTGTPKVLGLTDAELDRITTPTLIVSSASFASLTISAPISPANASDLTLNADTASGSINATATGTDVTLPAGGVLKLDGPLLVPITGAAADTGFPQLKVAGGVNLNGRALDLTGTTFAGALNQTFVLVDNDASDAVSGTFASLAEGALIAWPGSSAFYARISYVGGSGNDVVLTLVSATNVTTAGNAGTGSLRAAIAAAAANPGADTITFAPALSGQAITLTSEIAVSDTAPVTIDVSNLAGGATIDGNNGTRLFAVSAGSSLSLKNLTLTRGNGSGGSGGAVFNAGTVALERCTLTGNTGFGGGGLASVGTSASASLTNCTVAVNGALFGGGIYSQDGALSLRHCTISSNTGTGGTGGIVLGNGTAIFKNTIVAANFANNSDVDLGGGGTVVTGQGANLIGNNNGSYAASFPAGPLAGTGAAPLNPRLAPLANNGGPTPTLALLPGSPALDAGVIDAGLDTDQRGFLRSRDGNAVAGALPDLGAYEAQAVPYAIGFNFTGGGGGPGGTLAATEVAGFFPQANWNNLSTDYDGSSSGTAPNAVSRNDGAGATLSGLRLWWDAPNVWSRAGTPATPDEKLLWGYLDSQGAANSGTNLYATENQPFFAIASLPAAVTLGGYRVLVYADGATNDHVSEFWLASNRGQNPGDISGENDLTTHRFRRDNSDGATFTEVPATSTTDLGVNTPVGNVLRFDAMTEPGFTVRSAETDYWLTAKRADLNAVQIVRNEIIVVTTAADELDPTGTLGAGISLREAIRDAAPGSGIVFDPAVFKGEPADTITFLAANSGFVLDKDLTIDAGNIAGGVTINAAASNENQKRIFTLSAGRTAALVGLNLTGAYNTTLDSGYGGAIHSRGRLSLTACRLTANVASEGGAAYCHAATQPAYTILRRCVVSGNQGLAHAGAIEVWADGQMAELHLEDSTLSGNTTPGYGGAVWTYADAARGIVTARRTTATANQSYLGGAFNNQSVTTGSAELTLSHCTIAGNIASTAGGGIVSGNTGEPTSTATCTLAHTIIAGNSAPSAAFGPDLIKDGTTASFTSLGGNLIGKTDGSGATWLGSDLTGTDAAPLAALLAPLGNYGGPTQTLALLPGSPARNAATGSTATADQRGFPIVATPDIGSYEAGTFADYDAWIWETLPAGSSVPAHAATFDNDRDGRTNALEYAVLGDPLAPNTAPPLTFTPNLAGTEASVAFTVRYGASDLTYVIERSFDLNGLWVTRAEFKTATGIFGGFFVGDPNVVFGSNTITFTDPGIAGQPRVLYRVRVIVTTP